jgi:ABC-type Mn2+/Zn2+ transport system permease subunit
MVVITFFLGLLTSVTGIIASYYLNTPPGPTLVLAALSYFVAGNVIKQVV